jgi:ketosteroid isomerase-like protein
MKAQRTRSDTLATVGAEANKRLVEEVFAELADGNGQPFMDLLSDDVRWTVMGSGEWSRTYDGKPAVIGELMRPLFAQFADTYRNRASLILADGDHVVVECHGQVMTRSGKPYNQRYCYVCRMSGEKIRELSEYLDTELVSAALEAPAAR